VPAKELGDEEEITRGDRAMESKRLHNLILIPWLSVPIVLAGYLLLWNRIPSQLAVHFTPSGTPVTLMSRSQSLLFDLITLLLVLTISSWILLKRTIYLERILVRYYFGIGAMTFIFLAVLLYNI
jgi:hypothetical protein